MSEQDKYTDPGLGWLDQALENYSRSDIYPFHMPGHKRRKIEQIDRNSTETGNVKNDEVKTRDDQRYDTQTKCENADIIDIDITEIDGFDNLHHPEGILKAAQQRMARLCGADQSFFLVNGSTVGLLAAISAAVPRGGKILIARNCHKAVYHACFLRQLQVSYLYPAVTEFGIQGSILPAQVGEALAENPGIQAVLITSPTYDGVVSDIQSISNIVHAHGIPLIVDEAHGAHFGFCDYFPRKALEQGADLVIESMHKTLPSYTQTAALHLKYGCVEPDEIQRYLGIYQSSSPSYIFMAGLDRCTRFMEQYGRQALEQHARRLEAFYEKTATLQSLEVLQPGNKDGMFTRDRSKILISGRRCGISGQVLSDVFLHRFGLQMEMASGHYVTALTSLMDTDAGFERLWEALKELDAEKKLGDHAAKTDWRQRMESLYQSGEQNMEIWEAQEAPLEEMRLETAAGRISGEYIYLYPPGIPFLVPGERIPEELFSELEELKAEGFEVQGLADYSCEKIHVVGDCK